MRPVSSWLLAGCGGAGSSSGGGNPPPAGDFSVSVPANTSVTQGSSSTLTVDVTGLNGFSSQVTITISGLPTGVTAAPSQFAITPGGNQQVVITAGAAVAVATSNIIVTGNSGGLQHSSP